MKWRGVHARLPDAAAREVKAKLPGASIKQVGDMLAVLTDAAPYGDLLKQISSLDGKLLRTGIPIRAL